MNPEEEGSVKGESSMGRKHTIKMAVADTFSGCTNISNDFFSKIQAVQYFLIINKFSWKNWSHT